MLNQHTRRTAKGCQLLLRAQYLRVGLQVEAINTNESTNKYTRYIRLTCSQQSSKNFHQTTESSADSHRVMIALTGGMSSSTGAATTTVAPASIMHMGSCSAAAAAAANLGWVRSPGLRTLQPLSKQRLDGCRQRQEFGTGVLPAGRVRREEEKEAVCSVARRRRSSLIFCLGAEAERVRKRWLCGYLACGG